MTIPLLRPYQNKSIQELRDKIRDGLKRIVLVCPTGSGKTTIAAEVIRMCVANKKSVLFLAHRQELVFQAQDRIKKIGIEPGIIMSGHKHFPSQVNIASIQTLNNRNKPNADVIILDECHHSVSKSTSALLNHYNNNSIIIGLTATPYRLDGKPLGDIFQGLVEPVTIRELIESGYLVEPCYYAPKDQIDTSHIKKQHGEFNIQQLFAEADKRILYDGVVNNYKKFCDGQRAIVFNVNKQHSQNMRDFFIRDGISAVHIDCDTPSKLRIQILKDYKDGIYKVINNVGLLCEGYDLPSVSGIIINRATTSKCLYFQMCGRGLRPHEDKTHCVIIDHGGNIQRFGLLDEEQTHDLFKKQKEKIPGESPLKICPSCEALIHARIMICENCGHIFEKKESELKQSEFIEIINFKNVPDLGVVPERLQKPFRQMTEEELEEYRSIKNYKHGWKFHVRKLIYTK